MAAAGGDVFFFRFSLFLVVDVVVVLSTCLPVTTRVGIFFVRLVRAAVNTHITRPLRKNNLYRKKVHALLPFNNPAIEDSYFLSAGEEGKMICWKVHKLTDSSQGG